MLNRAKMSCRFDSCLPHMMTVCFCLLDYLFPAGASAPAVLILPMIKEAFIAALNSHRLNGAEILARLRDKASEKEDAYAWKLLIQWRYKQSIFSGEQIAEMIGMSVHSLNRRIRRYKRIKAKAV